MRELLSIRPDVAAALAQRRPVVAIESAVIAHGLPPGANVACARALGEILRAAEVTPALIAVLDGRIRVGLTEEDLDRLTAEGDIAKISRRDLAVVLGGTSGAQGATTVAATMVCAALAGIPLVLAGGIGGVHRGGSAGPGDISSDLFELRYSPVSVVTAGAKPILDLARTLEFLETLGVPVIGYGTDTLPATVVRSSGLKLPHRCDSADEVARILRMQERLGGGLLICAPMPEEAALPQADYEQLIVAALDEAAAGGVVGPALTPFLQRRLSAMTGGRLAAATDALLRNNAAVAAEIAVAHARLVRESSPPRPPPERAAR